MAIAATAFGTLHPATEFVDATITDAGTYVSKLSKPIGAHITFAADMNGIVAASAHIGYTLSGRTFTFKAGGVTAKRALVTVYGYL